MINYMSREAAVKNLENFFRDVPSDTISVDELFIKLGRGQKTDAVNKSWLSNKLTSMKDYHFIKRNYSTINKKKRLTSLGLTPEGKQALGRERVAPMASQTTHPTTRSTPDNGQESAESLLESVNRNIEILQQMLPSFYITFNIRPRRDVGMSERINRTIRKL
ncbi:MAG TPA: hypothetical protein VHC21_03405 [Candidatus Saccharimonadales bacterium]|nr:hypothetical protein [Candidatus Saccharimonadales bacterium]